MTKQMSFNSSVGISGDNPSGVYPIAEPDLIIVDCCHGLGFSSPDPDVLLHINVDGNVSLAGNPGPPIVLHIEGDSISFAAPSPNSTLYVKSLRSRKFLRDKQTKREIICQSK